MKVDQKGSKVITGLLILAIGGVFGLVGWYVWGTKNNTDKTYDTACSTTVQPTNNKSFQLPSSWNWYEIKDIGLKYAYPKSWDSPTNQTNSGKFDSSSGPTTTKAIRHNQTSYSSLSHWSSDAGNHYQLITYNVVSVESIKSVIVDYRVVAGSEVCPDDRLASSDQAKCINQSISDEVDKVI